MHWRLFLIIAAVCIGAVPCLAAPSATMVVESLADPITDEQARNVSIEALKRSGYDVATLQSVPFVNERTKMASDLYFARNAINKNRGYTLWKATGDADKYTLMVFIEVQGTTVTYSISLPD